MVLAAPARPVHERARVGRREGAARHRVGNLDRDAPHLACRRVEGLRHQRPLAVEEQVPGRHEGRGREAAQHLRDVAVVERAQVDAGLASGGGEEKPRVRPAGSAGTGGPSRPARHRAVVTARGWAAAFRHRMNRSVRVAARTGWSRHSTCRAHAESVGQNRHRPAGHVHFLQLAAGEERDRVAVGRPERKRRAFRAGQRLHGAVERPHPQLPRALPPCGEHQVLPAGRHVRPVGPVEPQRLRQRDVESRTGRRRARRRRPQEEERGGRRRQGRSPARRTSRRGRRGRAPRLPSG